MPRTAEQPPIFDFHRPPDADDLVREWFPVDDRVMGGLSWSRAAASAEGLVFAGDLSLEQNGGFASIRTRPRGYDLAGTRALVLRVRGDGKTYKLGIRTDDAFDGVQYQARFLTRADGWEDVRLPIADFAPRFRGRPVPAPPLDPARIRTFGLLIADRQAGPFRLVVALLTAERPPG
jgi:NADH dehydrogenase [ubiquinone] 1 alpha subcomplex assembly factor 1